MAKRSPQRCSTNVRARLRNSSGWFSIGVPDIRQARALQSSSLRTACVPLDDGSVNAYELKSGRRRGQAKLSVAGNLLPCGRAVVVVGNGVLAVHKNGGGPSGGYKKGRDFK